MTIAAELGMIYLDAIQSEGLLLDSQAEARGSSLELYYEKEIG